MLEAILCSIMLAIVYPMVNAIEYGYPAIPGTWWLYLTIGLSSCTILVVPIIETCRIWLISYDLHYLHSSKNQQWKTAIDASYAEKDWYLQNRGKWGNEQYIIRVGFIFFIATNILVSTVGVLRLQGFSNVVLSIAAGLLTWIVHVSIPIYLYIKTPRNLQDQFLFSYEFTWTAIITMTIFVGGIGMALINPHYSVLAWTAMMVLLMLQATPSLLSTLWISRKVSMMTEWNRVKSNSISKLEMKESPGTLTEKLRETLNDEPKCEAFIDWMYREFSSEAILSFLEFVQFKKYIKQEMGETDRMGIFDFELYNGMPQSTIIYDSNRVDRKTSPSLKDPATTLAAYLESDGKPSEKSLIRCKRIAHLLFEKYIDYHSEHEINISGPLRNNFVELDQKDYHGMDLEQFVSLYDEVLSVMMKYIRQSFGRFERANGH